eukprot:1160748-Pelagomonas_calceolata.AAC.10
MSKLYCSQHTHAYTLREHAHTLSACLAQVLALFTTLLGLEGRVIFYCFGQYIKLSAPWNWVAVTVALYGSAVVGLAHYFGLLGGVVDITVAGLQHPHLHALHHY